MPMDILDAATAAAVAAAADQGAQAEALIAAWAGGDVTVRVLNGPTLLSTLTFGPWFIDLEADPVEISLGARSARTFSSSGTPSLVVFRSGSTDIFSLTAGVGSGDVSFSAAIQSGAAENLSALVITALSTLPIPAAPAWTDITVGTWVAIPGNTLQAVDPTANPAVNPNYPAAAPWDNGKSLRGSIAAWCGATINPSLGIVWMTALGGHSDYYGNGVFRWALNRDTPAWTVIRNPSNLASYALTAGTDATYSDGTPRSSHSYNAPVYIPGYGPALAGLEGVVTDGRTGSRAVVIFSETNGAATFGGTPPVSGLSTGVAACFDPTRGTAGSVWQRWQGTSLIQRYDVATDSWASTAGQSIQAWSGQCSLAIHASGDYLLVGNGDNQGLAGAVRQSVTGGWCVFDCAAQSYHFPTFTGAPALNTAQTGGLWPGQCQPVWVPALGCFCAWDNDSSRTSIITITPPATNPKTSSWTVGTLAVDASNAVTPSAAQAAGTYGRFAYWPGAGGFVLLNDWNETGYFFKAHV